MTDALLKRMILSNPPKMIDKGAAASISSLACEVKDYIGDVTHDLGSIAVDPEKLIEPRGDLLALDATTVEEPSWQQGIHEIRLGVSPSYVLVLRCVYPVHRRKHKCNSATPGEFLKLIPISFGFL